MVPYLTACISGFFWFLSPEGKEVGYFTAFVFLLICEIFFLKNSI